MKYFIPFIFLLLAGCNSFDAVNAASKGLNPLSNVLDFDTNGYYSKRTGPDVKYCEYKVSANVTAWRPCKNNHLTTNKKTIN